MPSLLTNPTSSAHCPGLLSSSNELLWYAAYTSANHEKRVAEQLTAREIEHFLPLYESVRRWKDRRMQLQLPLFPGYVFVRLKLRNRLQVLQVPGVARLVGFGGTPTALPGQQIEVLRASFASGVRAEPHPYLTVGRRVRVEAGPFAGLQGILVKRKNRMRLVVSVELIQRAMAVEMGEADLQPVASSAPFALITLPHPRGGSNKTAG